MSQLGNWSHPDKPSVLEETELGWERTNSRSPLADLKHRQAIGKKIKVKQAPTSR